MSGRVGFVSECEVRIQGWPSLCLDVVIADKRELPHLVGTDFRDVYCRTVRADRDAVRIAESLKQEWYFHCSVLVTCTFIEIFSNVLQVL